jgi:hypothetical protein
MTQSEQIPEKHSKHTLIFPDPVWQKLAIMGIRDKTSASHHIRQAVDEYLARIEAQKQQKTAS